MGSKQTKHSKSKQNAATSKNATNGQENATSPQGGSQSLGKKVLSELSGAQITASVLAAVTALLFSSNIGIAGSVIGVAVSAGITALSSSIYKSFIEGTKQKMQQQVGAASNDASNTDDNSANDTASSPTNNVAEEKKPNDNPANPVRIESTNRGTSEHNISAERAQETEEIKRVVYSRNKDAFNPNNNKYTHEQAKHNQPKTSRLSELLRNKWFALVVLSVIALVSVLVTSHIITAATSGEGIGTKPQPIFVSNAHRSQTESSTTSTETTSQTSATASESSYSSNNEHSQSQSSFSQKERSSDASSGASESVSSSSSSAKDSSASQNISSSSSEKPHNETSSNNSSAASSSLKSQASQP